MLDLNWLQEKITHNIGIRNATLSALSCINAGYVLLLICNRH